MVEEFRLYHRKNGLIVKQNDDLLDATRYVSVRGIGGRSQLLHLSNNYEYWTTQRYALAFKLNIFTPPALTLWNNGLS